MKPIEWVVVNLGIAVGFVVMSATLGTSLLGAIPNMLLAVIFIVIHVADKE